MSRRISRHHRTGRRGEAVTAASRPRGRPRAPEVDDAILGAALRLLAERGYAGLSLDRVAAAAGVGKPTLYRRWSSKADLTTAALAHRIDVERQASDRVSTERALTFLLTNLRERLLRANSMALVGTLLAEEKRTPELIGLFRERIWRRRSTMLREVLERGRVRGEIRAEADVEATIDLLIGSIYARYLSGAGVPKSWPERIVALVLGGLRGSSADGAVARPIRRARSTRARRRRSRRGSLPARSPSA
jgi:AcrR family transcriptional regulator